MVFTVFYDWMAYKVWTHQTAAATSHPAVVQSPALAPHSLNQNPLTSLHLAFIVGCVLTAGNVLAPLYIAVRALRAARESGDV